ncbi:MAG: glycan-binding surface protein [Mediterranea sp.]|jgi:hypothetical protein|nr:glycan-binding surface protein [Mediterranea sp.]
MKKKIQHIQYRFLAGILLTIAFCFASCEDKDAGGVPVINSVWTNQLDVESTQIEATYNDLWVRLEGSGFSGLKAIYCNGVRCSFQPTFVTENYITFQIPTSVPQNSDVEDENERGTIRVVTSYGEGIYRDFLFKDKNKMPAISGVSNTLPEVGDVIIIEGNNLENTTEVYFPAAEGEVQVAPSDITAETRRIQVTVPASTGNMSGAIRIVCNGDTYYSPSYMFFRKGVFISSFTDKYGDKEIITGTQSQTRFVGKEAVAAATGLARNPDNAISWKASPTTVNIGSGYFGYVRFLLYNGIRKVIDEGAIAGQTPLKDLAIQFDLYCNVPWSSGVVVLRINKDQSGINQAAIYNLAPWNTSNPYIFTSGWRTQTVKFSQFPSIGESTTIADYIDNLKTNNRITIFGFINDDCNKDGHTPTQIDNFQMFMANIRIVPITVPE